MTTSSLRITDMGRSAVTFGSLEDAESWLDGYDYMAQHAQNLGFDVKAAERAALDAWDQKRIETVLSRD